MTSAMSESPGLIVLYAQPKAISLLCPEIQEQFLKNLSEYVQQQMAEQADIVFVENPSWLRGTHRSIVPRRFNPEKVNFCDCYNIPKGINPVVLAGIALPDISDIFSENSMAGRKIYVPHGLLAVADLPLENKNEILEFLGENTAAIGIEESYKILCHHF